MMLEGFIAIGNKIAYSEKEHFWFRCDIVNGYMLCVILKIKFIRTRNKLPIILKILNLKM